MRLESGACKDAHNATPQRFWESVAIRSFDPLISSVFATKGVLACRNLWVVVDLHTAVAKIHQRVSAMLAARPSDAPGQTCTNNSTTNNSSRNNNNNNDNKNSFSIQLNAVRACSALGGHSA